MDRFFCYGKKDFCPGGNSDCNECNFRNDAGGVEEGLLSEIIKGVFGDDYDLDRLRDIAAIVKAIPHTGNYCIGYEMEPKDGYGCNEYDSFVLPARRLRELVEADREGRCVVLPVKPGGVVRFAKNPRAKKETVDAITIYPDGKMSFGFHEYGVKTEWVDRWSEDDADKYVPVEVAEDALKGEQDA